MPISIIVTRAPISYGTSAMVVRQLSNHLTTWCDSIPHATFQIISKPNLIYLQTNSAELLDKYLQYEESYVEYLLTLRLSNADEWEMLDPKQAA